MYKTIGQRGDKEHFLENTLASFESVLFNTECVGIELDIDISKDQINTNKENIKLFKSKYKLYYIE